LLMTCALMQCGVVSDAEWILYHLGSINFETTAFNVSQSTHKPPPFVMPKAAKCTNNVHAKQAYKHALTELA